MNKDLISDQLQRYSPKTLEDEENALKEILQSLVLYALSTTDFFSKALFHRGTSLRILYDLPRFSEDLDFMLKVPDRQFSWEPYIRKIETALKLYGVSPEIQDRSKADVVVQKLFLKDNSIGKILNLDFHHHARKKLLIKLEIDTNPPLGSQEAIKYLAFPLDYMILTQDLPSNFAGKCHALLCRSYVKGRDWFDFSWYVSQKATVNFALLENAIHQTGPWQGQDICVDSTWLVDALRQKVETIDWSQAALEVQRFVGPEHLSSLKLWSAPFFLEKIKVFQAYLTE